MINQSMARQFWPGADPIGRRFTVLFSPPITVVGIVKDSRNRALAEEAGTGVLPESGAGAAWRR